MPALRRLLARQHALMWLAAGSGFTLTLTGPHSGLVGNTLHLIAPASRRNHLDIVAIGTAAYGALVAHSRRRLAAPQ